MVDIEEDMKKASELFVKLADKITSEAMLIPDINFCERLKKHIQGIPEQDSFKFDKDEKGFQNSLMHAIKTGDTDSWRKTFNTSVQIRFKGSSLSLPAENREFLRDSLIENLKHNNREIKHSAAAIFSNIIDSDNIKPLIELIAVDDGVVRSFVFKGLENFIEAPYVLETLIRIAKDDNLPSYTRYLAIFSIGKSKEEQAFKFLLSLLEDDNPEIRHDAVLSLGAIRKDKRAVIPLIKLFLMDDNSMVQLSVIEAFMELNVKARGYDEGIKILKESLENLSKTKRILAVIILGYMGDQSVIKDLLCLMKKIKLKSYRYKYPYEAISGSVLITLAWLHAYNDNAFFDALKNHMIDENDARWIIVLGREVRNPEAWLQYHLSRRQGKKRYSTISPLPKTMIKQFRKGKCCKPVAGENAILDIESKIVHSYDCAETKKYWWS